MKAQAWLSRFRWWRNAGQEKRDLEEEMALHQELRARQIRANTCLNADEALSLASRQFGNRTWLTEEATNAWKWIWMEDIAKTSGMLRAPWVRIPRLR